MKRFLLITLTILLLVAAMAVPAFATTDGHVAVSDAGAKAGDLAYVTVSLSGLDNAASIAVQMKSDLALNAEASEWLLDGEIETIDADENVAAFAWNKVRSVNGEVLKLAYQIPENAERDTEYSVEVTVEVRDLENQLCEETVSAKITVECTHAWKDADCTTARTCKICGATQGGVPGHKWNAATCTEKKTCAACGTTQGEALGHSWKNATCTVAKTCGT